MKALAPGQFVQQFQIGALGARKREGPVPLSPGNGCQITAPKGFETAMVSAFRAPGEVAGIWCPRFIPEKPDAVAMDEALRQVEAVEPGRGFVGTLKTDGSDIARKIVRKALQFERGAPADDKGPGKQGLKRDHHLLPAKRPARSPVDAAHGPFQPAGLDIIGPQVARDAFSFQPGAVDEQTFRQFLLEQIQT